MATATIASVAWKKVIIFFTLLLLAYNISARELVARTTCEPSLTTEMNDVIDRRLFVRQLDTSWRGNYFPPPKPPRS
ncbi:hypothetical protein Csa_011296 [Cucumis sativus]|uniref:Uncharacterized protein n=1 Tax=Cucumis sativus TaxID=3659 RepID=A0A0A0L5K7_CUCSA|nr:hypothetical protein Csa_011296 [Cucumis sativus]